MRPLATIGHLARDVVSDGPARIGGAPWYAGRALRLLGTRAQIGAKCGEPERRRFLGRLTTLGLPVTIAAGGETTAFAFRYEGERRLMTVEAVGEPWSPQEATTAVGRAEWVHVAPLLRSDFPVETLDELARDRRLLLDGQGLVRVPEPGPLRLDSAFDPALLRHAAILKLAEEEAVALVGGIDEAALRDLPVPEIVVTLGAAGSLVLAGGRCERVPVRPLEGIRDPTGAGDAFAVTYLAARAEGHAPASAARRATALVAALLSGMAP